MKILNLYITLRNFCVNNFFVDVLCLKQQNNFIYLNKKYLICRYILFLCPFYFVNLIASKYNYDLIYKKDGTYGITNIQKNRIIPHIKSFIVLKKDAALNIKDFIYLYNPSIPLSFFINTCNLYTFDTLKIIYLNKGVLTEKEYDLKNLDIQKYLIYNLFENK
jgi:hypothetical protein